jgi:hypothetical protein
MAKSKKQAVTNISPELRAQFNALSSGKYTNFALFSCFVNGKPSAAIVAIGQEGEEFQIRPLFVAITPDMVLTDHENVAAA